MSEEGKIVSRGTSPNEGPFPKVLQWYYVPYEWSDPTTRTNGHAWMEFGVPEKITCAAHIEALVYNIRQHRHSPETAITPLNIVWLREAEIGEPDKKLLGDLPPA